MIEYPYAAGLGVARAFVHEAGSRNLTMVDAARWARCLSETSSPVMRPIYAVACAYLTTEADLTPAQPAQRILVGLDQPKETAS